jgi:predicted transcriptional regulator
MPNEIEYAEWLQALEAASIATNEAAMTTGEIAAATGRSRDKVIALLKIAKESGKLRCVRVRRENLDGRQTLVPGYEIVNRKGKK